MKKHYLIVRENKICYVEVENLTGMTFKPINSVFYNDGCMVAKIVIFKPEFIEWVLKKKIQNKLNVYLSLILSSTSDDDEDSSAYVEAILYDINRYKKMVLRKYKKYLDKRYLDMLLRKIDLLEKEMEYKLEYLSYGDKYTNHRSR